MPGSTFLLAQAQAPDAPQQPASCTYSSVTFRNTALVPACPQPFSDDMAITALQPDAPQQSASCTYSSVAFRNTALVPACRQPYCDDTGIGAKHAGGSASQCADFEHEYRLRTVADKVNDTPVDASCEHNKCPEEYPLCPSCGSVARAMPVKEAARLVQRTRDTSGLALECMDRLRNGMAFTCKDGNPLSPYVSGWHRDYFAYFQPCGESKRTHSEKSVQEMQEILEKETETLLKGCKTCIYELKCYCKKQWKYLCVFEDRKALGLARTKASRTKFQDRKNVSEGFWWMFAAIEWEDHRVGSKRKKTT